MLDWHLQAIYPKAYSHGSTYRIGTLRPEYKGGIEVEAWAHVDIISLCWALERKEEDDPPTGWEHKRRELDNTQLGIHPPPPDMR